MQIIKKLINKFFDRVTPKLPQNCVIEPVHEINSSVIKEKTPMTAKEKIVIDKLYYLLNKEDVKIEKCGKNECAYYYKILIEDKYLIVQSCQVLMENLSILHNPSDEARVELKNILEKIIKKYDEQMLSNFLKL